MTEIPSDIASSAAQTGFKAGEVSKERAAHRAGQAAAASRQVKASDETDVTVETTDSDTQVFSDAEGGGSYGRAPEEEAHEQDSEAPEATGNGITTDDDGRMHLDLEA